MAKMNFDKAIAHFSTAHTLANGSNQRAIEELAAGLQRLAEALHGDLDQVLRALKEMEKKRPA